MIGKPYGKPGVFGGSKAFLEQGSCLADSENKLVLAAGHHVHARVEAVGKLRLIEQGLRCVGIAAQKEAEHVACPFEVEGSV